MTIDEAIKILTRWMEVGDDEDSETLNQAERLGIEALKGIKKIRRTLEPYVTALLPGETENMRRRC